MKCSGVPFKSDSPFVDGRRLAVIGNKALEIVYLDIMFYKEPVFEAENLLKQVGTTLQQLVEIWVSQYRWRNKVRHTSSVNLDSPEETRLLFNTYVGAVFIGGGYKAVRDWIELLVNAGAHLTVQAAISQQPKYEQVVAEPRMGMGMGVSPGTGAPFTAAAAAAAASY
ncbi:hypothetical protein VTO73DRAFT_13450 [Trametes versicolor]